VEPEIQLGDRIVRWREYRALTQAVLAAKIEEAGGHCSPSAVAQWELNQTTPTQANLQKLTEVLDITLAQFWGRVPARKKKAS
jgi:transcriptional regulator with XRE-family HTH domain